MRPRGEIRVVLVEGLHRGPATTRELAMRTQVGLQSAMRTLDNMRRAGEAVVVRRERVPGVSRPVPVYELAEASAGPCAAREVDEALCCWFPWTSTER